MLGLRQHLASSPSVPEIQMRAWPWRIMSNRRRQRALGALDAPGGDGAPRLAQRPASSRRDVALAGIIVDSSIGAIS